MLIEEALYTLLSENSDVTDLVGERIYPVTMPQLEKGTTFYPAIVFELASRQRQQTHLGPNPLVRSNFTIYCITKMAEEVGQGYFAAKGLADAVRLAVNGRSANLEVIYGNHVAGVFLEDEHDEFLFDPVEQLSLYSVPMEFQIQHKEEV